MKAQFNKQTRSADEDGLSNVFPVMAIPIQGYKFRADIFEVIESPSQFADLVSILNGADEETDITINIQTPGGSTSATDYLLHALYKTKAHVHMIATGGVHSAGSAILLAAHSFELSVGFHSLIHCGSLGSYGNFNEFTKHSTFVARHHEDFLRRVYAGFLTEEEIISLINGGDLWVGPDEWMKRYENKIEYMSAQVDAIPKEKPEDIVPKKKIVKKKKPVVPPEN